MPAARRWSDRVHKLLAASRPSAANGRCCCCCCRCCPSERSADPVPARWSRPTASPAPAPPPPFAHAPPHRPASGAGAHQRPSTRWTPRRCATVEQANQRRGDGQATTTFMKRRDIQAATAPLAARAHRMRIKEKHSKMQGARSVCVGTSSSIKNRAERTKQKRATQKHDFIGP